MSKIPRLYINPGHSNTDPGAVGYAVERELNVKVSNFMKEYLLANYVVEIRMNPGTMGNLYSICKDANDWGADLFVSNHFNAAGGDGYEALVYSEQRRALGEIFEKYVEAIGQNSRGVKIRTGLVVLRDTNMPAVLNEGAFVDNKKDIEDWNEDHELQKMGEAYAKAAAEAMKLERKTEPEPEPEADVVYRVQVGAFRYRKNAEKLLAELKAKGYTDAFIKASEV
jgi:N-acetylmuramoyl-L-alanine amidase